jgi:amino acid permease
MESIKFVLLIFGLSFIASEIVDAFNLTWWGFWLIVIIIIVAYTSIVLFFEEGGFQEYREIEIERKAKRKEYENEQRRLTKRQRSTYKNPNVYQETEDINSTKNDCPNCGRSDGRHDPKCYI